MRLSLRAVSALLLAVGVATCSEAPTSANRRVLQLALAPRFSAESQAIFRNLASFSVTLDNVHVVVRATLTDDQLGPVLKDTTITFPATASEVRIAIELTIQGSQQSVIAAIELREGATSYFGGSQLLLAKVGETTSPPAPVEMSYIGPGAAAQSIFIGPQPATLAPSTSFPFAATAFDVANRAVAGLPITWSVSDPTVFLVSADGLVTSSGKVGSTTLIATGLNGVSAQITVRVQPVARLVVLDGDNQTATAGTLLSRPFLVQALDADGNPVIGAMVNFSAAAGGSVTPASATTN
ncbi:MAG: hypothetical protein ACJ78M_02960, partial [Gemmatimonadaceae bacterium]